MEMGARLASVFAVDAKINRTASDEAKVIIKLFHRPPALSDHELCAFRELVLSVAASQRTARGLSETARLKEEALRRTTILHNIFTTTRARAIKGGNDMLRETEKESAERGESRGRKRRRNGRLPLSVLPPQTACDGFYILFFRMRGAIKPSESK